MNKHMKIYVGYNDAKIGNEVITDNNIWVVRAVLRERIQDRSVDYQVLVEFVEPRLDRLDREQKEQAQKIERMDKFLMGRFGRKSKPLDHQSMGSVLHRILEADILDKPMDMYLGKPIIPMDSESYFDLGDYKVKKYVSIKKTEKTELKGNHPIVSMYYVNAENESRMPQFRANCGACGASLYTAVHPSTFKEVFPVERPFCFHCGNKVDPTNIETDPEKYCNGG